MIDTTLVPTHSSNAGPSTKGLAPSQPLSPEPFDFDYGADDYDFKESVIQSGNQENEPKQVVLDHFCEITPKKSSPPKERTPPPVACPKPSHQTPDAKPVSRRDKESNLAVTNAGVTGRAKVRVFH